MADEVRTPPVAIRITRPYGSQDEFLRNELDSLTRTTVTLTGAQSRPQGVVLRFEVTLSSGDPLLRGEGRVVGFRPAADGHDSGLTLRFTRLDARSKALVDRAAALRDARSRPSLAPRPAASSATALQSPHAKANPTHEKEAAAVPAAPPSAPNSAPLSLNLDDSSPLLPAAPSSGDIRMRATPRPLPTQPAPIRAQLLDRLRQRAKTLSPAEVETLLASRPRKQA